MLSSYFLNKNGYLPVSSQSQRVGVLDLTRIIAIILMIQGHTLYALTLPQDLNITVFPWNIWHYLRGLTAPVFLVVSGAVHVFANKRDESGRLPHKTILRRFRMALLLIAVGYMMMLPTNIDFDTMFSNYNLWEPFFQVKILQLIGISQLFLLLTFILTRNQKSFGILSFIIAIAITLLSPLINEVNWFNYLPHWLAPYFSSMRGSNFTLFPYAAYLFFGASLGCILREVKSDRRISFIQRYVLTAGMIFFGIGIAFSFEGIDFIFTRLGLTLIELAIISVLFLLTKKYAHYYSFLGRYSLFIYVVHLLILYGPPWTEGLSILYGYALPIEITIISAIINITISIASAYVYDRLKKSVIMVLKPQVNIDKS